MDQTYCSMLVFDSVTLTAEKTLSQEYDRRTSWSEHQLDLLPLFHVVTGDGRQVLKVGSYRSSFNISRPSRVQGFDLQGPSSENKSS
jgi:hypothetical protein